MASIVNGNADAWHPRIANQRASDRAYQVASANCSKRNSSIAAPTSRESCSRDG